jgi:hypothetical protein
MATKIYGESDDLIEIEGDVDGEVNSYGEDHGTLLIFSDGTLLEVMYGKEDDVAIWSITPIQAGPLFDRIEFCFDEDASPHSDIAYFKDGLKWAYAATGDWEKVH